VRHRDATAEREEVADDSPERRRNVAPMAGLPHPLQLDRQARGPRLARGPVALGGEAGVREPGIHADELEHPPQGLEPPGAEVLLLEEQQALAGIDAEELLKLGVVVAAGQTGRVVM